MSRASRTVACCIGIAALTATAACGASGADNGDAAADTGSGTLLAAWIARTLPAGVTLVVDDSATRTALARSGVDTTVVPVDAAATAADPTGAGRYRISLDAAGVAVRSLSSDVTAVPVARFGGGDSTWLVDRLVTGPADRVVSEQALDTARRVSAGAALLTNPAVTVCAACTPALSAGGLDLRAASLVAVLAASGPVLVQQIVADPAETRADQPARTLVIGQASPGTVRAVAAATVGAYRPTITGVTATATTLTWNLTAATTTTTGV